MSFHFLHTYRTTAVKPLKLLFTLTESSGGFIAHIQNFSADYLALLISLIYSFVELKLVG